MSRALYLDTARLGLMSPSAQHLQNSFARLAGDPHGLLYFSEFLSHGAQACPADWNLRFPGLANWRGVKGLTQSVRELTGASQTAQVLFASRSATLMHLAATQLADSCQRVLSVDLLWPPYRRILARECRQVGTSIAVCSLRTLALSGNATPDELMAAVCRAYRKQGCDGLVLPLIDHRGITLPAADITARLRKTGFMPKLVIVERTPTTGSAAPRGATRSRTPSCLRATALTKGDSRPSSITCPSTRRLACETSIATGLFATPDTNGGNSCPSHTKNLA